MTIRDLISLKSYELAMKTQGLGYLFTNYHSEGTSNRERESIHGIGVLLESFAEEGKRIASLIEISEGVDSELTVEYGSLEHDPLGIAQILVRKTIDEFSVLKLNRK